MSERLISDKASIYSIIDEIISSPTKKPAKEEAYALLKSCGIIDENNNLEPEYEDILIKKKDM